VIYNTPAIHDNRFWVTAYCAYFHAAAGATAMEWACFLGYICIAGDCVATMNIRKHDGSLYVIGADTMRALQIRFPLADVERELLLAGLWLEKNPASLPKKPLRFVENWLKKSSPRAPMIDIRKARWWSSEKSTLEMANKIGLSPKGNETWEAFRARISDRLNESKTG